MKLEFEKSGCLGAVKVMDEQEDAEAVNEPLEGGAEDAASI